MVPTRNTPGTVLPAQIADNRMGPAAKPKGECSVLWPEKLVAFASGPGLRDKSAHEAQFLAVPAMETDLP